MSKDVVTAAATLPMPGQGRNDHLPVPMPHPEGATGQLNLDVHRAWRPERSEPCGMAARMPMRRIGPEGAREILG